MSGTRSSMALFQKFPTALLALLATSGSLLVDALDPNFCASTNLGSSYPAFQADLQSNGLCYDHCKDEYAFAITQGDECWCTNYAPADSIQVDLSDCNDPCQGYPPEPCGGDGVFGYVELPNAPSGTKGTSQPTSSTKKTTTSEPTAEPTTDETPEETTSIEPTTSTEPEPTTSTSTSTSSRKSTTTSKPTTSAQRESTAIRTVTADGTVKTVFIQPTDTASNRDGADGEPVDNSSSGGNEGLGKGALAGIIVGVALGVIAVIGLGLFFYFRRRRNQQQEEEYQEDPSIRGSSSGAMGSLHRPEMTMSNSAGGSPSSPDANSNRNSTLMVDPRMDPFKQGLYMRNGSHESINTLRDDHDYSRKIQQRTLRATNPDPDTEADP